MRSNPDVRQFLYSFREGGKFMCCGRSKILLVLAANLLVAGIVWGQTEVVPVDAMWRYLSPDGAADDPGDADPSFDTTWFTPGYDDSGWDGPDTGPFEYGGVAGLTNSPTVSFLLEPFEGDRYTNYFRHEFNTTQSLANLGVDILADDGAVVYLDGQEVLKFNCCRDDAGANVDDYLSFSVATGNEDDFRVINLDSALVLDPGDHVLAVSAHQAGTTSSDLGLGIRLLAGLEPPPPPDPNAVLTGVDTLLAAAGQSGPDAAHGAAGEFEWDGSDGGGENHAMLWFDIPQERLDAFGNGTATLQFTVTNDGNNGNFHRMTSDWLSGADGGDAVTWNNIPDGPGIVPGQNAEDDVSFMTGDITAGDVLQFDVTADVMAWASGQPNYGWGIVPTGTNGSGVASFESSLAEERPQLIVTPGEVAGPALQAGDADMDLDFDQLDLVQVQIAAKYLSGQAATWGEGDWDGAPGGSPGNPPAGDGFFNQFDIIASQIAGLYLSGPYAAINPGGSAGDEQTSIIYDPSTGEVAVDAPASTELTSINIDSAGGVFTGDAAQNLGGSFDNDADDNIFKATFGGSFGSLSFGNVAQTGLSEEFVLNDLSVVGSLAGGGALGDVDLIYVPEPSSWVLLLIAACAARLVVGRRNLRRP